MSLKGNSMRFILSCGERLYTQKVREAFEHIGMHNYISSFYRGVELENSEIMSYNICGIEMDIRIETINYQRNLEKYISDEEEVIKDILYEVGPDSVFYDIGAYYGAYATFVGLFEERADVHAFEPGNKRCQWLRDTLNRNDVDANVHNVGLGSKDKKLNLTSGGEVVASGGVEEIQIMNAKKYIEEEKLPKPTIVKIDVEGGESDVVEGMRELLSEHCRVIYCEVHTNKGVSLAEIERSLEALDFEVEELSERGSTVHVAGKKTRDQDTTQIDQR